MLCTVCSTGAAADVQHINADLLVVGGSESGVAAAIQAARMGVRKIVLVNDIEWLGGQFSAEALVAIDENTNVVGTRHEQPVPRHGLFKEAIDRIERANLTKYGVARPGNTRVITTTRPADAAKVFDEMLQPYVKSGQVTIVRNHYTVSAKMVDEGRTLKAVRFRSMKDNSPELLVEAKLTIDASDWGDAIKAAGAAYEFGPDLKRKYGEPEAPASRDEYPITDMNPITWCMVIEETDKVKPIPKPANYDARNYSKHRWPHDPLWLYGTRRVVDHYHFKQIDHADVLLLCFPAFDYPLDKLPQQVVDRLEASERGASTKNIVQMTRRQRQIVFEDAKQYSLGFLYYLQTDVHEAMPDKTHSFGRFKLTEEFGTPDKLPPKPYVRESLRLRAMYMMRQQDSLPFGGHSSNFANVVYPDAVAVWQFEYDFHPTKREFLTDDGPAGPWRNGFRPLRNWGAPYSGRATFPLRSLIPEKVNGLLAAQHNLGFSSIVSSAVRLHDQSMAVGQAAGAAAAIALKNDVPPRMIPFDAKLMDEVWQGLCTRLDGGEPAMLCPFRDVPPNHDAFEAINLLAVRRGLPLGPRDVDFKPEEPATAKWRKEVVKRSLASKSVNNAPEPPFGEMTRGEFAIHWWKAIKDLPNRPWIRQSKTDADGDGRQDADDPLPFTPQATSWAGFSPPHDRDGLPDRLPADRILVRQFNFTGKGSPTIKGYTNDNGLAFDRERGHGWAQDISTDHRRRNHLKGEQRDTFIFTRKTERWECVLPHGQYHVTVCVGDSAFEQPGQRVLVEGKVMLDSEDTLAGEFVEKTMVVNVNDGRVTIDIGRTDRKANTCLNWVQISEKDTRP